ncbi:glycosyltransferase [Aquabacterium fontiphilum]|jgi:glycosyltransferase involved in cell wall biosynthesis|uniref:glycosyltransferase n=1 Tax=Aquabacterium fontiphilum TaxID=450365 RepID=UPI0013768462|nr:glycosyltransferase [Aquabacterium fontiphilum]NBD22115.1 glycosyltransferase [Aquabacterium fontiphilum]
MAHLIVFSHLRWHFVHQRPQHLLSRLAPHHPVIYVEEPVETHGLPHLEVIEVMPHVTVLRPHTPVHTPGFHDEQFELLEPLLAQYLAEQDIDEAVAWFYTPMALPLMQVFKPLAVVYDCMDELSAFKGAPRVMRQQEYALLRSADVVFTGGLSLYEAKRELHPHVHCLPSAVDVRHYAPTSLREDAPEMTAAMALQGKLPHPMIGFFGVIDERMNLELIASLADAHPEWSIVLVGPVAKIDHASLPRRANIHWLGMQPYALLPYLVKDWDLCMMPFALNEATQYISPTKTLEYLAAEKPVVSTSIRDVVALYGDVVYVAKNPGHFIQVCEGVLQQSDAERARYLSEAACCVTCFSWDDTAKAMRELIEAAMQRRQQAWSGSSRRRAMPPASLRAMRGNPRGDEGKLGFTAG